MNKRIDDLVKRLDKQIPDPDREERLSDGINYWKGKRIVTANDETCQ